MATLNGDHSIQSRQGHSRASPEKQPIDNSAGAFRAGQNEASRVRRPSQMPASVQTIENPREILGYQLHQLIAGAVQEEVVAGQHAQRKRAARMLAPGFDILLAHVAILYAA